MRLYRYDANNEIFQITIFQLNNFDLHVPIDDAPSFKEHFGNVEVKNIKLFISNNTFKLASADFYNPANGKTHKYKYID